MKNHLMALVIAIGLMFSVVTQAERTNPTEVNRVLSTMTNSEKEFLDNALIQLMASDRDNVSLSVEQYQFIGGLIDKITGGMGKASDALRELGSQALEILNRLKLSDAELKNIPVAVIEQGEGAIKAYVEQKAMADTTENKAQYNLNLNDATTQFFLDDLSEKLKGVWESFKGFGSAAWDAIKGLGGTAREKLDRYGVTTELIEKIPRDVLRRGLEAIIEFARQKGWIPGEAASS